VLETAENNGKDIIAVVGADATTVTTILAQVPTNDRIIISAPGIRAFDAAAKQDATLSGTFSVKRAPQNNGGPGTCHG
jgi:hypothetical protein